MAARKRSAIAKPTDVEIPDRDFCPVLDEAFGDRASDALGAARDDGIAAFEIDGIGHEVSPADQVGIGVCVGETIITLHGASDSTLICEASRSRAATPKEDCSFLKG